jgi:CheY-like chemotaxis protein
MARILVVDDDGSVRGAIEVLLAHEGHSVTAADGGRAGIDALGNGSFDIVIVDIFMPGMGGLEAIRAFRDRAPGVPIIAMSGFMPNEAGDAGADCLAVAGKLGAVYCLPKPFRPRELTKAVHECLARRDSFSAA